MKIGSVGVNQESGLQQYSSPQVSFGNGVSQALGRFGERTAELGMFLAEKQYKDRRSKADLAWIRWEGEETRRQLDRRMNAQPGADGFTEATYESTQKSFDEFTKLVDIPEEDRAEYEQRFRVFQENSTTNALAFEFEESTRKIGEDISTATDRAAEEVRTNTGLFAEKKEELDIIIDESSLPPIAKEELKKRVFHKLAGVVFERESMLAASDSEPVGPTDGGNAVAPGLTGAQRGFLNGVARPESGGSYHRRYAPGGGANFDDLSQHPGIAETIDFGPYAGQTSTAAGRYQILLSTWNDAIRQMRVAGYTIDGSFSEVNQDRVAWFISDQKYRGLTGRDLYTDLHSGDPALLRNVFDALGAQGAYAESGAPLFQGFQGEEAFAAFVQDVTGQAGLPATPGTAAPNVWDDPRFAELPYDMKVALASSGQDMALDAQRNANTARTAAEKQTTELAENLITTDPHRAAGQIQQMIEDNPGASVEHINDLLELAKKATENSKTIAAASTTSKATRKELSLVDTQMLVESYAKTLNEAIDRDTGTEQAFEVFDRLGALPESTIDLLLKKANSGSPAFGMRALVDLYSANPADMLALLNDKEREQVVAMTTLREYQPDDESAARQWAALQSPELAAQRERLQKQADEEVKNLTADDILKKLAGAWERNRSWLGGTSTVLPKDAKAKGGLMLDSSELFRKNFVLLGGDSVAAWNMTIKELLQVWGANPTNGELMKYAPTIPEFNLEGEIDGHEWIDGYIRGQLELPEGASYAMVGGSFTYDNWAKNGAPLYTIIPINVNGEMLPPRSVEVRKPVSLIHREGRFLKEQTVIRDYSGVVSATLEAFKDNPNGERFKKLEAERLRLRGEIQTYESAQSVADRAAYKKRLEDRMLVLSRDTSVRGRQEYRRVQNLYNKHLEFEELYK